MKWDIRSLTGWEQRLAALEKIIDRYPWVLPLISFVGGFLSFTLVHRGHALARLIAWVVLGSWIWLVVEPVFLRLLRKKLSSGLTRLVSNFVTQTFQQELLFFILPFIILSTRLESPGQMIFTGLASITALVSVVDPLYDRMIASDRVASFTFHAFCTFLAAMVVIPISAKIPVEHTFLLSMIILIVWLIYAGPILISKVGRPGKKLGFSLVVFLIPVALFVFRGSIPPAGIRINHSVITDRVTDHQPGAEVKDFTRQELESGVYAFASVVAPQGLHQEIIFHWRHDDYSESVVADITGGRQDGYRVYSVKKHFMQNAVGTWTVEIKTPQGQLLDILSFAIKE